MDEREAGRALLAHCICGMCLEDMMSSGRVVCHAVADLALPALMMWLPVACADSQTRSWTVRQSSRRQRSGKRVLRGQEMDAAEVQHRGLMP